MEIKNILHPIDFSAPCARELELAIELCQRFGCKLVLQHNVHTVPPAYLASSWIWWETQSPWEEEAKLRSESKLQELLAKIPSSVQAEGKLTRGPADVAIVFLAQALPADLIIIGTNGPSSLAHQSVAEQVVIHSPCPVLTIHEDSADRLLSAVRGAVSGSSLQVLVPMDFRMHSIHALEYAYGLMKVLPIRLNLLHVEEAVRWEDIRHLPDSSISDQRQQRLQQAEDYLRTLVPDDLADRVSIHACLGSTAEEICHYADQIHADRKG
jgi:nucleotide-binding universal stress UspA family protein